MFDIAITIVICQWNSQLTVKVWAEILCTVVTCNTGRTGQRSTGPCFRGGGPLWEEGDGRDHQDSLQDDPPVRGLSPRTESLA